MFIEGSRCNNFLIRHPSLGNLHWRSKSSTHGHPRSQAIKLKRRAVAHCIKFSTLLPDIKEFCLYCSAKCLLNVKKEYSEVRMITEEVKMKTLRLGEGWGISCVCGVWKDLCRWGRNVERLDCWGWSRRRLMPSNFEPISWFSPFISDSKNRRIMSVTYPPVAGNGCDSRVWSNLTHNGLVMKICHVTVRSISTIIMPIFR